MTEPQRREVRVCVVVPCYNEARRLNIDNFGDFVSHHENAHMVFVDDGSHDNTREILERFHGAHPEQTTVLSNKHNLGKAETVRRGVEHGLQHFEPRIVGYWDADLATPLSAVDEFLNIFEANPALLMVFGARVKLLGRHVERSPVRHYLGRVFATVVSNVLQMAIYDTQCGAKLFRADDAARSVFEAPFLSKWVFDVEILARYLKYFKYDRPRLEGCIYEYPLEQWVDIAGSKVHPEDFLKAFWDIVRIKHKYL